MEEYEVEIVTDQDEVEVFRVTAASPEEAEQIATEFVESGESHLYGQIVIYTSAL